MTTNYISSGTGNSLLISGGETYEIEPFAGTIGDRVQSGGVLVVLSSANDKLTSIDSGGTEYLSGGSATSDGYYSAIEGTQVAVSGGEAYATTVGSGGTIVVSSFGTAASALVSAGGTITVLYNGEATGDSLISGAVELVSGGLAFGEVVNAGAALSISSGSADGTILYGGGLVASFGATVAGTTVSSGGLEAVDAGGATSLDKIYAGGAQSVTSKGVATSATVYGGGSQHVASGGSALATVLNGGTLVVAAGGSASATRILPDGSLDLQAGGIAVGGISFAGAGGVAEFDGPTIPAVVVSGFAAGDTIDLAGIGFAGGSTGAMGSGGVLSFTEGASAYTLAFDAAGNYAGAVFELSADGLGTQIQLSGIVHSGPVVGDGEVLSITSGQISSYVTVDAGGFALVSSGGLLSDSLVNNGGTLDVEVGAIAAITVASGGFAVLDGFSGHSGMASGVTVEPGGTLAGDGVFVSTAVDGGRFVPGGVSAVSTTVNSGGVDDEEGLGLLTIVNSGGSLVLTPNSIGQKVQAVSTTLRGGGESVEILGTVTDTTIDGGLLLLGAPEYPGAISATGAIAFGAGAGTLAIDTAVVDAATISGFAAGDSIDVLNLAPGADPTAAVNSANQLVVSAGGTTYELGFAAGYGGTRFQVTSDTGSGSLVSIACFAAGTSIATDRGDLPVEALVPGDHVHTQNGRLAPVRWIGHRDVACDRHPRPERVWPVRIAAGAFGAGRPARDLYLSPDHAVFRAGVLIPARHLIDGIAIAQVAMARVSYWHVELDRHDVLLAEALPCESFLDTTDRTTFATGGATRGLHPDVLPRLWDGDACAPLVLAGPLLDQARACPGPTAEAPRLPVRAAGS